MSKFDEKCSKCRNYNGNILICESCAHYKPKTTLFDRITASPEVLAPKFVYCEKTVTDGAIWYSLLLGEIGYSTEPEAIAATVEKLNEVEN